MGLTGFDRCLVFNSLSKRSNLPGLRSGFVAGDAGLVKIFLHYRTYRGCSMPPATQTASTAAWSDEQHVIDNRIRYCDKFDRVLSILSGTLAPKNRRRVLPVGDNTDHGYQFCTAPVCRTEYHRATGSVSFPQHR